MAHSKWLRTDLHIHSHVSKLTKDNDYNGSNLTYDSLVSALQKENVNLFSITDHNIINVPLYSELIEKKDDLLSKEMNFLIGAEIDFLDTDIYEKVFHMLVFFNTEELEKVCNVLKAIFKVPSIDDIDKNVAPIDLQTFFKATFEEDILDIITIPHFNSKDKGIPGANIDKLVYTVFSALEDSNNRQRLVKSIQYYKDASFLDVPVIVFSDNHDISIYPAGKNKDNTNNTCMHVLGNVRHPFNSVKSAFQDVETRISIENVSSRRNLQNMKYIKALKFDDNIVNLSEYQNTIIGGFGTGKSFLLDMILNGKDKVDSRKYSALANKYNNFTLIFSDGTTRSSLNELNQEIKIVQFNQYKDIYFADILLEKDKVLLEHNLQLSFPCLEPTESPSSVELTEQYQFYVSKSKEINNISDIINYGAISKKQEKAFSFKIDNISPAYNQEIYFEDLTSNLEKEITRTTFGRAIYSDVETQNILETKSIIETKNSELLEASQSADAVVEIIEGKIVDINTKVMSANSQITSNIKILSDIKNVLVDYIDALYDLKEQCDLFESHFEKKKLIELSEKKITKSFFDFDLVAQYKAGKEFDDIKCIFKSQHRRDTLFTSIISTLHADETFTQSRSFEMQLGKYIDKTYGNFTTICYDIYANGISIMKRSAGEKANIIINIIFRIVEDYSKNGIHSIVLLDQPEDNLDNKGITKEVVNKIRTMKIDNLLPQLICVTHNPNISITADSENILLATKTDDKCTYTSSGIEDSEFVDEVCKIVEGGTEALRKRGIKFNIPIIKELGRGGVNE